jgi:putative transposase
MAHENRTCGAVRIVGELRALEIEVSASTVRVYRREALRRPPSPSWQTFLRLHSPYIWAADFFTVQTLTFRTLYVFVVLGHQRREIVHWNVTSHPTAA